MSAQLSVGDKKEQKEPKIRVNASMYNMLRIFHGMGGLAWASMPSSESVLSDAECLKKNLINKSVAGYFLFKKLGIKSEPTKDHPNKVKLLLPAGWHLKFTDCSCGNRPAGSLVSIYDDAGDIKGAFPSDRRFDACDFLYE